MANYGQLRESGRLYELHIVFCPINLAIALLVSYNMTCLLESTTFFKMATYGQYKMAIMERTGARSTIVLCSTPTN